DLLDRPSLLLQRAGRVMDTQPAPSSPHEVAVQPLDLEVVDPRGLPSPLDPCNRQPRPGPRQDLRPDPKLTRLYPTPPLDQERVCLGGLDLLPTAPSADAPSPAAPTSPTAIPAVPTSWSSPGSVAQEGCAAKQPLPSPRWPSICGSRRKPTSRSTPVLTAAAVTSPEKPVLGSA